MYIADGSDVTYTSLSEKSPEGVLTLHNVRLHVLGEGDEYDLIKRDPVLPKELAGAGS